MGNGIAQVFAQAGFSVRLADVAEPMLDRARTAIENSLGKLVAKNKLRPEDVKGRVFYYGKGCEACNNTGYRGRQGIYEIMLLDDDMRDQIIKHASTQILRLEAKKRGKAGHHRVPESTDEYPTIAALEGVVRLKAGRSITSGRQ